ncbi:hypothetical protein SteCoe_28867 [Stentor coeruleus]|uniref:Uncharacterized protein n=1 Tax=Stentor coeruleus TaxID=5963 RepID=A0A1R2B7A3_9CILI|nr:hypothetical protein SteCoe_28867 [Stentor coeruleus]
MGNICGKEDVEIKKRLEVLERKVIDKNLLLLEVMYGKVDFDRKILINTMYDSSRKIKKIGMSVKEIKDSDYFLQKNSIKESLSSIKKNLYKLTDLNTSLISDYDKSLIRSEKLTETLSKNISKMIDKTEVLVKSNIQTDLYKFLRMRLISLKKQLILVSRKAWLLKSRMKKKPNKKLSRYKSCPFDLATNLKTNISIKNTLFTNGKQKRIIISPQNYKNKNWNNQFSNLESNDIDTCATLSEDKRSDDVGMNKMKMSLVAQMLYEETIEIKKQINRENW